jgi:hypothetical protein
MRSFFRELSGGVRQQSETFELALELPVEDLSDSALNKLSRFGRNPTVTLGGHLSHMPVSVESILFSMN